MTPATAPVSSWLDPAEHAPPPARKLLLLTRYGVTVLGPWRDDCVAWSPLPRIPQAIKEKISNYTKINPEGRLDNDREMT